MNFPVRKLSYEQQVALRAMWNSVERCMNDANGNGKHKTPEYLMVAKEYARKRMEQYFNMIEALIAREDA